MIVNKCEQIRNEIKAELLHTLHEPCLAATAINDFYLVRREDNGHAEKCFERPLFGLVIQGTKHSLMGGHKYVYGANQSIVAAVDMPITSYVLNPTHEQPFLFLYLYLDKELLASLLLEMKLELCDSPEAKSAVSIAEAESDVLEMCLRLLALCKKPEQIAMRAPMMLRELHYLLLIGPHGRLLRQINTPGTQNNQVVQAIHWIRENYTSPMRVESLARQVNMSTANLHRRFKLLTGLSPLQYQKQLRLHEAQRLIIVENERVSNAAFRVGYESITQFTREYKRVFGASPLQDIKQRRALWS